jgi:hypothetical protein
MYMHARHLCLCLSLTLCVSQQDEEAMWEHWLPINFKICANEALKRLNLNKNTHEEDILLKAVLLEEYID